MVSPHLERLHRQGRRAHPELALGLDAFAHQLGPLPRDALTRLVAEDLYLATACELDVPGAWDRLVALYRSHLETVAQRQGLRGADADEIVGTVLADLTLPGTRGTRTRIGAYDGTGRLETWLGVQVVRAAIRLRSGPRSRLRPLDADTSAADDPVEDCETGETAARLRVALNQVWTTLTVRERLALTWKFGHGLPQTVIAPLLGVGTPRVSRIVEHGVRRLRDALRERLPDLRRDGAIGPRLGEELRAWLTTSAPAVSPQSSEVPDAPD